MGDSQGTGQSTRTRRSAELSAEEIAFFKHNGYLIVQGGFDAQLCAEAVDRMWQELPADSDLRRDDPATHTGPFSERDQQLDSMHLRDGFRWQQRQLGSEQLLIDLVYNPLLCAMAEQLLGKDSLQPPVVNGTPMGTQGPAWPGGPVDPALGTQGTRGIYCTLPYGDKPREPDLCHTDGHPFNLGIVGLINDVPPDGGAFKVWPESHRRLYPTFVMSYDQPRIPFYEHLPSHKGILHTPQYDAEIDALLGDTQAVDCHGRAGDVVFWHHRTAHMAGHNYTDVIRQAVLYDFSKRDLDEARLRPPQADMWADWSERVRASGTHYSSEFARTQNLLPG